MKNEHTYISHPDEVVTAMDLEGRDHVWTEPVKIYCSVVRDDTVDFGSGPRHVISGRMYAWVNGLEVRPDSVKIVRHVEANEANDRWTDLGYTTEPQQYLVEEPDPFTELFVQWMEERW